nr:MAG TPA: Large polyvalent protein-associated domain 14 [Caudoviricetes sp.]
MPNKITYTIKTADGKEHQVSKENIDKHGIQAYADAYEGATIRMRDSKKGDYDIPLANYNDAKAQGLHAFSWEHLPPKAQPQTKQQVAQKQPTQQVATTAPGTPMTAAQKAQVLNNVSGIVAQSQSDLSRTMRKFDYAKQNTGLDVKPIKLGENRNVATKKNKNGQTTYLDAEGNRFDDQAQANFSQNQIEEDEAKRKDLLGYIDKKAMSSVNSAYDKQYSELEDFKKKHPYLSAFSRALSAFSGRMSGGGTANINQYRPEEARAGLAALALNQKTRQAIDEGKRYEQGDTGFWGRATRGLKKGLTSASTYDLGLSDTDIAGSLKGAADRYAKGQATQIDELLLDAAALNSETEGKYADALGGWFGAGEGIPGVASFMMQIGSNPMSGFGKATAQSVAKTVTKRAVQKFGTGLAAKAAITLAKGATRVAADAVEAGVVTAMYSPTKIVGDYLNRKTGTVVHDGNGGYTFEGKEYSDIKAVAKAINDQNAENLSEMWGDYLPGIGKVGKLIGKGARKIGLGKVVNAFEQMSSSQWMKTWNEFMDRTKWNGLSGEYMEEAEKNLYNALTNGDMTLDTNPNTGVFSRKINEDTFKSVALMSGIMSGISTVGYTRFKYKASRGQKKADNNAKAVLGAEKWSEIKKLIDNADDKSIGGIIEQIGNDNSLNTKQKMAILDYQYKSAVAHGANIQDLKNKLEGNYDEKANRYDAGYNATEDELANIKNELELRQRQLAETFKDDPKALQQIEDDPKAFLQGLKESEVGGEKAKVINAYEETRAAYDGMIQRVKDNIDDAVTENNTVIEQRTHQDGNIYPATMKLDDRKVYVVGGNVQMNEDGKGIDHEKSSSSVMIRDAETGKIEMVDPSAILSIDTPVNAEEEKATSSEQIRQTYAQEQANKIDGVLDFKAGDTYSILGEDQKQHTIQIIGEAIDEKTKQPNPDMVMASIDGLEPTMLPKEQIQAMNDEENLWRLEQSLKQDEDVENETPHPKQSYNLNDEITLINEDGKPVRGSITTDQNEDGKFEVYTEEPINGKRVNLFTAEELDAMTGKQQEQTNQAPVQEEQGEQTESPALVAENATTQKEDVAGLNDGTIAENATVQKEETPQHEPTALERIPTNEQGEPIYEQADPETAWDAIVEQTEGDESIAQSVADGMVADMEAAVRRAEKAKVKGGTTIAEKIAAEKERVATIEQAKATLEHWKKIASTNSRRQEAIQAEESRKAKEAALLRKEQEEKERAMREEEERVKRDLAQPQSLDYKLSDEIDENGHPFVLTSAGEVAFGKIGKETGLAPAPILLSEGVITNSKTNAGYGLVHIEARHGEQIRNAGYPSVVAFVEEVAKHYDVIREGINRSGEQTYMLQLTDRHNNTLMVELSGDGTYYNINTAGIFKTSYGKNRREVYNRHTTDNQSTESGEESQGEAQSGTTSPSRMKSSTRSSAGKVSETSNAMQENAEKTSENEAKELATNAVVEALVRAGVPVEVVSDEAAKGVLPLGAEKHVVYHGSGAKFDHFDHSHMGEGEGAQAYGWGSYVTEVEGIGKKYAQAMLKEKYKENRTINEMARDRLISDGSKDESLKYLNDLLKEEWVDKKRVKAQIKIIETGKFLPEGKVSLYTVDIPDNTGKNYLDWESDIPVKEKNRIRIALTKSIIDKMGPATSSERQDVRNSISTEFRLDVRNFKGIYKLMSSYTSPQEASELLRNLGYTGISYPAQYLSGGRSDGARNYVIFDEKDLKITNRVEFMKSPDGVVYGWTIGGRIYLTKAGLNPETPIHEYTHIWANAMKVHNMKGWKSIKELLVDTPIWDEVLNDENYSNIRNDEDSVASEVLSRISGKENAKRMEEEAQKVIADSKDLIEKAETLSVLNRVRKALKTFWSWVGKELFDIEKFNSINEVTDRVLYDLVNGTALQVQNEATRVETNPTEAQKEAGNYKKGHIKVDGMNITIEQPKGSIRRGKDASGKEWESEMHNTYGYIRGTEGVDGDHIDIFLSDNPNEGNVFVVDQVNKDGSFDEHKVMYGFADKESARKAYLSNYEDGWQGLGNITEVSKEEFKKWIGSSKRKTKPFAEYKGIIKSNKSVSSPVAMSEDEYLTSKGLNGNMTDYMLDKLRIPHSETARQQKQREKEAARVRADFDNQKEEARKEYRQKIAKGELREPTKQEAKEREIAKLIKTANGHEDNPSVQAARRLLAKRGVDWRTDKGDTSDNDWLKSKEDGKSNVVHSFGNSASQNDTSIKLSDTSFAKMKNGEQKAEEEIGWLVDHNIRLKENSRKLDEIAHLLFDGDNIDSNRESALREEAKKILEENEKLSRDYQKNYSDKYFGTDDITANYILQEANERLIALGVKPVKESYYFQNRKNEVAQNAVVHLLKRIGIPVHFISRVGAEASGQGNSRGWTNGLDIWLTKDNINAETPVHEYTHIWTFALMKNNPKLWAEIKNLLKDSEWVDTIQSMDEYKYTLDNEDLLYSEVLSRISGERNGEKFESMAFKLIEEVNSVEKKVDLKRGLEKLRDALKRFWEWVGVNLFGMKEFKSVDDVCDRVLFDLLNASDIARTEEMREYYEEEREMNTIIDKAKEDGTYLKTPNGEDTKLPEKVWAYARTKKFKTQLSDRLNLILNESKEDFKDWEKEEFRDLFKKHGLLEEHNEPGRFLVSQFMYSEKYYDRKGKMQEEAKETMNSGKGGENVSSVKSVDMRDAEYIKAVENNDTETIQRLLSEEAERKGYSKDSSYQGSLAFNGAAPSQNAYFETKEERKEAWENDDYEDTMSLGDYVDSGIDTNNLEWNLTDPMALRQADPERREAIENLRQTVRSNSKTITIYRAVDANIKENEIRNGDWVTPSRSYAEYHIGLQNWENGRVIEQEVSIDDLWWDGNDIAEWGYDNGKGEVYKNTPNNRKMFEVTYDDKGNIIPLSERFNEDNDDIRYRYEELEEVNQRFNKELDNLTEANADKVILLLGKPSDILLSSGIENKPMKLYGNKIIKKMKKHGFALDELRDLPKAVADPIAVFDNYQRDGNRSILTELRTQQGNFLVSVNIGKDADVDFNIVRSVFGKGDERVVDWINNGLATYMNKEKTLSFLSHQSAPIAATAANAGQGSQSYISTSALNADATYKNELSSAANIVKSFENPINNSEKKLDRKSTQGKEVTEKERQQMADRANELAKTLHLDNVEIVTDASTLEGKKAKAKGFYSTSTGKITIVIPNHSNIADVEKTLLHESVAHYGLRKLFGEHFDNFLDNVFKNASEDVRREIVKLAAKNKWDFRIATEEYLASLAEDTNFENMPNGLWDKVKRLFLDMLRSIGLLKQKDGELNDNELRYILWRSYKNLKEKGQSNSILNKAEDIAMQHRLKVGNYSESTDKEVRFRDGEPQSKERVSAAERYEQRVSRSMFQSQEALQDSMLGLKEAMDAIMRAEGKEMYMEDIEGFENAYLGENRLSSVNQAETEAFAHLVFKPMLDEVAKLAKNDKERSELTDYMMAKHGLERNEVMRKNALEEIINNEKLSDAQKNARASIAEHRDYAGLTALTDANSVEEAESEARRMVEEYEQKHDTTNLWDKVNTVTKGILQKSYECGMMNKQTYEKVRDMYQFYIPLRGFDEETSREAYAYLSHGQSAFNAPIKTAKGRSSKADDPFANMQSMAENAIMQGNRNVLVKQKFLNFALNHPSDLVSVNALWLKYDDVKEEWRPVFPDNIEETDTADEVEKKIQDFEQRMAELAKQDPERYKHGKDTENIPYRIVESRDLRQHQVVVKRNGRDYVLTINGNPRAAQALNGLTNPDNDVSGAIGAILNFGEKINRQLSAFYTTRNPDFVISNFIRDMLYANSIVWVKERPNYALRFHRNIGRCNPAQMKILLSKHKKGELDMNNSLEHMFHQFIMNGGETGYANVRDIEQHKNDIQRELKRANGKIGIKRSLSLLGEKLDEYNRAVENCARFAAFLTSREMGRTIDRSIYDAKDISVNFNKKGSGAKFMKATGQTKVGKTSAFISGIGRSGYVFWNAAIQGTTNFGRQFKRHPAKAFTASATMFILGALIAGMGMGDDGDDDKNSYWNLPESVRRSNILFRVGEQWISIPLPVEYRSIYGMGELMVSAMSGKEHFTNSELGKAIAGQVTQILPIDFLEGEGGVKAFVPSAVKPFAEVISNKGWTGMPIYKDTPYNKNMPEWTKTYKSANKYLVGLAKILNEKTGGDAYTKGTVNINPAQIEYLLNGYFGGVSNTIDKLTKSAETIAGKRDYDPKSFLLLNRVLKSGDERTEERAINREYYRLKEEYEILRDRLKNYENDTDNGVFDYSEKINFLYNSPEYARYEIFEDYREDIEGLYKELKDPMSDEERASIEAELTGLKKQMIEEMNATRK